MGKESGMSRVRLWLPVAVLLVTAALACQPSYAPTFRGGARLSVEPARVELGKLPTDTPRDASFVLRNVGDTPLRIERAFTRVVEGCCPTQPQLGDLILPPGGKAEVSLRLAMGPGMVGMHRFEVVIESNDAVAPQAVVEITADFVDK